MHILGEGDGESCLKWTLSPAGFTPVADANGGERMAAACRYIHDQFTDEIRQPEAARRASLSPAAFSRYFHKHMGKTFEAYVNEVRIGHVCRVLLESNMTIAEAAYAVGYNNLANFNRRFRSISGRTPSKFRAAHRRESVSSLNLRWLEPAGGASIRLRARSNPPSQSPARSETQPRLNAPPPRGRP